MTRTVDLTGKTSASLDLKARYDIEADFDYLYAQASHGRRRDLDSRSTAPSAASRSSGTRRRPALTGTSDGQWLDMHVPLDSVAGGRGAAAVPLQDRRRPSRSRTASSPTRSRSPRTASRVFTDGAEAGDNGWTLDGFRTTKAVETEDFDNFYIASNRTYESYDKYMKTGPYNVVNPANPDWVEHFPYETGLGVWYWDTSHPDNNTSQHQGAGLILPIDAHPAPIYNLEGLPWRERIAGYDAPFSLNKADSFTLHVNGKPSYVRGQAAGAAVRRHQEVLVRRAAERGREPARRPGRRSACMSAERHVHEDQGRQEVASR